MTLLDKVLARRPAVDVVAQPQAAGPLTIDDPQYPLTSEGLLEALHIPLLSSASGVYVDEKKSLAMPAVWRAVTLNASTLASLPLHPYRKDDSGSPQLVTGGNAADLLASPHPDLTAYELWEIAAAHVELWGNTYLRKLRDQTGVVRELWPIHPSRMTVGRSSAMDKVYALDGEELVYSDRDILHIPGFGYDGVIGLSPIRAAARQGVGLALAAEEYGARLFGSGSLASGILTTEQRLTQTQADALKTRWKAKVGGLANAHEIAILDAGAKFEQLTIPPEDAQFIQSRSFQVEEISRIYGIPPHLLMSMEKSTSWGTGIEQQTLGWIKFGLRSRLSRFEQRVTKILAPAPIYARYSLEGLLRGDSAQRSAFYKSMWEMGVFSTNDIRALEEMAPVKGGDMRYRSLNFGELGTADTSTSGAPASNDDPTKENADA